MSLFDDLIGSTSSANSNNNTANNEVQQQSQTTTGSQTQTGSTTTAGNQNTTSQQTSGQTGTSTTSSLDPTTIALIASLLNPLAASAANPNSGNAGTLQQIAQQQIAASKTPAVSASDIAGEQSAATTSYNEGEAVTNNRLIQSLGSNQNTYAALTQQAGQKDLASTLAGITAQAGATNATISAQDLASAVQSLTASSNVGSTNVANIAALLNVLKGASTTTTSDTSDITNAIQQLLSAQNVNSDTNQSSSSDQETSAGASSTGSSSTAGTQGSGLLGMLF